jgi:anti-sigma B factor antagonist
MDSFDGALQPAELRLDRSAMGDGVACLSVTGEIDMTTGDRFSNALTQALNEPGVGRLVLDFGALRFMDSNGVNVLITAHRAANRQGITFEIVNAQGAVRHVLEMLEVYELLAAKEQGS